MSKRCAHCGEFNPRRSMQPPGSWIRELELEHGYSSAGRVVTPFCRECYEEARDLIDTHDGEVTAAVSKFISELDTMYLIDEVSG